MNDFVMAREVGKYVLTVHVLTYGRGRLTLGYDYVIYEKGY